MERVRIGCRQSEEYLKNLPESLDKDWGALIISQLATRNSQLA
ncbi:hypothetical protein HMPREF0860_2233 [Treponema socranskii subsp. socranskii VPI DR56BR1116 = ATCC 35536]|uniref:Uncharacterized protein n=1 Tax=Treponema socranskii subsp. socranskii VPI DR56BR1116 = ATCC 35536 TaxID=1125725 RepID=U2LKM1_TRESO|nr:hypothetical protein HMPREF1325_2029 [Treponema socranskii subsp. socranskii VPI DR56BR1116 = ATCC 35536]ERK04806.1 hypothetical protein HMPREF0860_2233 [Treponema socranskii subsp. socranskii VPI DR56BR1116 = ATCC 35536]